MNKCMATEFVKSFRQFERCVDESTRMGQQDDEELGDEGRRRDEDAERRERKE